MKRLSIILLTFVFLMGAIGIDVKAHYCGDELMEVSVNGLPIGTSAGQDMPGCGDGDGCHSCRNIYKVYKVHSQFSAGQKALVKPALSADDWFHGGMPVWAVVNEVALLPVAPANEAADDVYLARSRPAFFLLQGPLRAPPVV